MPIPDGFKPNFETLLRAAAHGDLALVDCEHRATGRQVVAICAMSREDDGQSAIVPLARMFDGNPYDELNPPDPVGGYHRPPLRP